MAYLWGQLISMDGNTVSCCENEGVKDQNGNDLRLCSAIDQERVQDDPTEENVDTVKVTLVQCGGQFIEYRSGCTRGAPNPGSGGSGVSCTNCSQAKLTSAPKYIELNVVKYCGGGPASIGPATMPNDILCEAGYGDLHCRVQGKNYDEPSKNSIAFIQNSTKHKYGLKFIDKQVENVIGEGLGTGNQYHNKNCSIRSGGIQQGYYVLERLD